jgi:hypothetical protein
MRLRLKIIRFWEPSTSKNQGQGAQAASAKETPSSKIKTDLRAVLPRHLFLGFGV